LRVPKKAACTVDRRSDRLVRDDERQTRRGP
jgi:hypothetical protein